MQKLHYYTYERKKLCHEYWKVKNNAATSAAWNPIKCNKFPVMSNVNNYDSLLLFPEHYKFLWICAIIKWVR